jgi:hypothetical protein
MMNYIKVNKAPELDHLELNLPKFSIDFIGLLLVFMTLNGCFSGLCSNMSCSFHVICWLIEKLSFLVR